MQEFSSVCVCVCLCVCICLGGGATKNSPDKHTALINNFFFTYIKENYTVPRFHLVIKHFSRWVGVQLFQVGAGVQLLLSIETYKFEIFPVGGDATPPPPPLWIGSCQCLHTSEILKLNYLIVLYPYYLLQTQIKWILVVMGGGALWVRRIFSLKRT